MNSSCQPNGSNEPPQLAKRNPPRPLATANRASEPPATAHHSPLRRAHTAGTASSRKNTYIGSTPVKFGSTRSSATSTMPLSTPPSSPQVGVLKSCAELRTEARVIVSATRKSCTR